MDLLLKAKQNSFSEQTGVYWQPESEGPVVEGIKGKSTVQGEKLGIRGYLRVSVETQCNGNS